MTHQSDAFASSTGQVMTGAVYLDNHFESARSQYEAQLQAVGIQPGWRVLDAACGSGPFLPWLADLVGIATGLHLPDADQAFWSQLGDPAAIDRYLGDPDCWLIESNVLAVGTVPHERGAAV